ncbi:hypothetical protein [uncultured Ruminococcus sp.]|uniref:hypothetical protein n=1 Tax=uncultured Ruminococcus sp. TaxID=165186 RepID=UPI002666E56F|nr:hypothetical protein [uncultured Ruminococcus sp.]
MFSSAYLGKKKRMERIITNGRMLVVPVDDSLIFGPFEGLGNLSDTINSIVDAKPSAILGYKGSYSLLYGMSNGVQFPFIINVTASTITGRHIQKIKTCTVLEALVMGADCVAAHINFSSDYENDMIQNLAGIISDADRLGMPTLAIAYPRKVHNDGKDDNYEIEKETDIEAYTKRVCHCVRVAVELGSDIIKTQYTGSAQTFQRVVDSALGRPVIIAGGPVLSVQNSYRIAKEAIEAGAAGISYGRNVFNAEHIEAYIAGMKAIVFNDVSVNEAMDVYMGVVENV